MRNIFCYIHVYHWSNNAHFKSNDICTLKQSRNVECVKRNGNPNYFVSVSPAALSWSDRRPCLSVSCWQTLVKQTVDFMKYHKNIPLKTVNEVALMVIDILICQDRILISTLLNKFYKLWSKTELNISWHKLLTVIDVDIRIKQKIIIINLIDTLLFYFD